MLEIDDQSIHAAVADVIRDIEKARRLGGISKYRLAKLTGLHPSTIGLVERGERNPSLFVVFKMAEALEISLGSILTKCEDSMHNKSEQPESIQHQSAIC